jgi:putative DNA primase/helicase
LEVKARDVYDAEAAEHDKEWQLWKLRKDAAESRFKLDLKKNPGATVSFDALEPEEPTERRYVTNDTTYEKLGEILAQNPNGVLAHRDELVSLLKTLDREEFCAARGFFLTAWGGTTPYKFDRITRGKTHIEAACLSLLGSTQPGRLAEYVRRAVSGGAGDDGLIQRFGLLVWPDQSPEWKDVDRFPDSEARRAAWGAFEGFEGLTTEGVGAVKDEFESVPYLRFDDAAQDDFLEWRKDLESKLRSGEFIPAMEAHLAKYRKLVPALALISHLADNDTGPVGQPALLRAIALSEYFETHAKRAYGAGPEAETAAAKAILTHIRRDDLKEGFSARDVHQRGWSNLTGRDQVQAGLDLLCDLDWLTAYTKPTGGRPTTHYRINPSSTK